MTEQQTDKLLRISGIGKTVWHKNKGSSDSTAMGVIEDEVFILVSDYKHVLQRIKFSANLSWDGSEYAYRSGYWTYDSKGKRIVWGQFTQFLTENEYKQLLQKARNKGWPIFDTCNYK